jgi:hypothetical protein
LEVGGVISEEVSGGCKVVAGAGSEWLKNLTDCNGPLVNARQTHRERRTKGCMMSVNQNTPTDNSVSDPYLHFFYWAFLGLLSLRCSEEKKQLSFLLIPLYI